MKLNTALLLTSLIFFNLGYSQEKIEISSSNPEEVVKVYIYFNEDWKFQCITFPDNNGTNQYLGCLYNPFDEYDNYNTRKSEFYYVRATLLTYQNIEDYLNGETIFPFNNCEQRENWVQIDGTFSTMKKQNVATRIVSMSIAIDLKDNAITEGHKVFFEENGEDIKSEYYCRYFDNLNNFIKISRTDPTAGSTHGWKYECYTKTEKGAWNNIFTAYIQRDMCLFYFYNHVSKKQMFYLLLPEYAYKEMGVTNDVVYEMDLKALPENLKTTTVSKYNFFKSWFEDYPNLNFRILNEAYKLPFDSQAVLDIDIINNYMELHNVNFEVTINDLFYDNIIKKYCNDKKDPFYLYLQNSGLLKINCF
jgi:hypothetical protein